MKWVKEANFTVMDKNQTFDGDQFVSAYRCWIIVKLETYIMLYVNFTSLKKKMEEKEAMKKDEKN